MDLAYFDSSVFLAIFNGEPTAVAIKALLRELKADGCRVCTSIITIQEVSVLSFRAGTVATDNYAKVNRLARIHGISKDIALTAAKLEAQLKDRFKAGSQKEQEEHNRRRKWDCFHIATAIDLRCRWLYSLDPGMLGCQERLLIGGVQFSEPVPRCPELFPDGPAIQ